MKCKNTIIFRTAVHREIYVEADAKLKRTVTGDDGGFAKKKRRTCQNRPPLSSFVLSYCLHL